MAETVVGVAVRPAVKLLYRQAGVHVALALAPALALTLTLALAQA